MGILKHQLVFLPPFRFKCLNLIANAFIQSTGQQSFVEKLVNLPFKLPNTPH